MRTAKILVAVAFAILLDTTPGSSWGLSAERQDLRACLPAPTISLLSQGSMFQISLISSNGCNR